MGDWRLMDYGKESSAIPRIAIGCDPYVEPLVSQSRAIVGVSAPVDIPGR